MILARDFCFFGSSLLLFTPEQDMPSTTISSGLRVRSTVLALNCLLLGAVTSGCRSAVPAPDSDAVKQLIQSRIDASLDATRAKDIDRYMSFVPQDWSLRDEKGATLDRNDLRRGVLEQWSIIEKTVFLSEQIDRLTLQNDTATVWTSQRWERLMHQRTGPKLDDVLTTQKHEEHWRFVAGQWWCYGVKELGGEIYVNGQPYHE
jgi:hypothetical protein